MGTRGFIGYKKDGEIKGFYNHNDSYYSYLGLKVLDNFKKYSNEEIEHFFTEKVEFIKNDTEDKYYENHRKIWEIDWLTDTIKLQDGTGFLWDSLFCEYGYVYNLDAKVLEIYRGFFKKPQLEKDAKKYKVKEIFIKNEKEQYFTHLVCTVNKDEIVIVEKMFDDPDFEENNDEDYDLYKDEE